ncbi:WD40 repeat-like protein [Hypoxylon sp. FL0890]|nr:WD40 repeat-like protein [Hypoxylon sp. FL0890]
MSIKNFGDKETRHSTSFRFGSKASLSDSNASGLSRAPIIVDDGIDDSKGPLGLNLLFTPSEPRIDFIFVHGLGGGSRKTWSKSNSASHFWPQEWLPKDPAFKDVRIHSFGYNSDYAKGKDNCLNIHHFGKSLLGEMSTSPYLADSDTAIVLIGHSMGGLVIKKAYMLARQDASYKCLGRRFYAIYFLATPHRGSDSAKTLKNLLRCAFSLRAYVGDLQKGSGTIQVINDDFRQYSTDIDLWSFYETQHLDMGVFSRMIVDPDSAVLGFRGEKQMPMNADHRSICKFETPNDQNYLVLRNALVTTISGAVKQQAREFGNDSSKDYLKRLDNCLGISALALNQEDDLMTVEDSRVAGTCEWFSAKTSYIKWRDFEETPRILWVSGLPASGKSVLAGSIIEQLHSNGHGPFCSYFFFKHADKTSSRLGSCLRSLAFQMASADKQIRRTFSESLKNTTLNDDNDRALWRKLFTSGIFKGQLHRHYWIIDALDECSNFVPFFDGMLAKIDSSVPLRILVTSRYTLELDKLFTGLGPGSFHCEHISPADTLSDIKRVAQLKSRSLVVKDDAHRNELVEQILLKSQGSFLWTVLVLNELSNSYSEETISEALAEVPREMEAFYKRTLDQMSQLARGRNLIQAILAWTTCATRPLTTTELEGALRLDINDNFVKLDNTIAALCGQLVVVDNFGRVQMVHATAREFLVDQDLDSEFAINPMQAHTRIAKACLRYLTGEEMKPPRTARRDSVKDPANWRAAFSGYACDSFSYHLAKADPGNMEILILIETFLKSNVISWIEAVARTRSLTPLIRTAKHLKIYLHGASMERSPPGRETQIIKGWTTDLIRIAAKFAGALISLPSAIYSLILPFCPAESMASITYKAAIRGRKLSLLGLSETQWDDRLSCMDFRQSQPSAICYGDELFAIGLRDGRIALYHTVTCQEYRVLDHAEPVRFLQFKLKTELLASCGMKLVKIWNVRSGATIHTMKPPFRPISLVFSQETLMIASYRNYLATWDLSNNALKGLDRPWNDSSEDISTPFRGQPSAISISVDHGMLAVAYNGRSIILWDLEEDAYYGSCGKKMQDGETSTHLVTALVFNPNKTIGLLVASYLDGELALVDPFNDQEIEKTRANCHTLAASPNGRFLGGGAGGGVIDIFEFDTLRLIYRVKSSDFFIKEISFSRDSLYFADIRGAQCNVWDSAILLREAIRDDGSEDTTGSLVEAVTSDIAVKISSLSMDSKENVIFCGKDDGSVCMYDLKTGKQRRRLYAHKSPVRMLEWWGHSLILSSVDISNVVFVSELKKSAKEGLMIEKNLIQSRLDHGSAIAQILSDPTCNKLLLSTRESDHLWTFNAEQCKEQRLSGSARLRRWLQHPNNPALLICINLETAKVYKWDDWSEVTTISLAINFTDLQLKNAIPKASKGRHFILLELSGRNESTETRGVYLVDAAFFGSTEVTNDSAPRSATFEDNVNMLTIKGGTDRPAADIEPLFRPHLQALAHCIAHVVGFSNAGKLVFLDKQSWICSIDIENMTSYSRHFFVPYDWFAGARHVLCGVGRDVVFARNEDVVIAKGGMDFVERIDIDARGPEEGSNV